MSTAWVAPGDGATLAELRSYLELTPAQTFNDRRITKRERTAALRALERAARVVGWDARTKLQVYSDGHYTHYSAVVRIPCAADELVEAAHCVK